MFDGVPADQFHQFLAAAASSRTSLPIPLSFSPLHHQHHQHHGHHGVSVPIPIPSSAVSAPPAPVPVIAPAPNPAPAPTQGFLGCFDLYPSHQILEPVQPHHQHHQNHHSGLRHAQLHHRQSPPADRGKNDNREERNLESTEGQEEDRRGSISVVTIPPPPAPAPAAAAAEPDIPWSNDEVLTLLRIRSGMENWFPQFTWEHVSRKLGEHGYRRSADKCKEKFEEESRHFNCMSYNKNYRFFTDLDELYHDDHDQSNHHHHPQAPQVSNEKDQDFEREEKDDEHHHHGQQEAEKDKVDLSHQQHEAEEKENEVTIDASNPPSHEEETNAAPLMKDSATSANNKKRKRKYKFEMFKGFCETVVKRIIDQQEALHNKLIQDMLRRDEECIAREEAWRCQEMERFNKEIEMRAQEQVISGDRQTKIIDLLKKFTTSNGTAAAHHHEQDQNLMMKIEDFFKVRNNVSSSSTSVTTSSSETQQHPLHQNPTNQVTSSSTETKATQATSPNQTSLPLVHPKKYTSSTTPLSSARKSSRNTETGDTGKRWPRDEVQALINLKCSQTSSSNVNDHEKEASKGPLWERISQGMLELGYKRSAKRCKEKWENINKYFRKTKDSNKKRSAESRTCPYFHQLSRLYSQSPQHQGLNDNNNNNNTNVCVVVGAPNSSDDHVMDKENCPNSPPQKLAAK